MASVGESHCQRRSNRKIAASSCALFLASAQKTTTCTTMTDQELKDLVAGLAVKSDRLDAQLATSQAKSEQQMVELRTAQAAAQAEVAETSRVIKEVGRRMGAMASNQGDVAEEFFYNTLFDKPEVGNIRFDRVLKNIVGGKPGRQAEFDVVMHNGSSMAVIEVKYKAHLNDIEQVQRQMQRYRDMFPEYKDYKLYGGLAGFSVPDDVAASAREQGLFVLKRKGDLMEAQTEAMKAF